jgi:hypothetical protein
MSPFAEHMSTEDLFALDDDGMEALMNHETREREEEEPWREQAERELHHALVVVASLFVALKRPEEEAPQELRQLQGQLGTGVRKVEDLCWSALEGASSDFVEGTADAFDVWVATMPAPDLFKRRTGTGRAYSHLEICWLRVFMRTPAAPTASYSPSCSAATCAAWESTARLLSLVEPNKADRSVRSVFVFWWELQKVDSGLGTDLRGVQAHATQSDKSDMFSPHLFTWVAQIAPHAGAHIIDNVRSFSHQD